MIPDMTVLLIEDAPEIWRFLRTTLPPYGYRVYEAANGAE
jgi:two-component system KDP operon response regulator KdpE